jgi:ribosome-binding factor A
VKDEREIKRLRYESVLTELIGQAIGQLGNENLHALRVSRVECGRGKDNATVYIDGSDVDAKGRNEVLKQLKVSSGFIVKYCLALEDWYKMPKLAFKFDDSMEASMKIDSIFHQIEKERLAKENNLSKGDA